MTMVSQDRKEEAEEKLAYVEYLTSFSNPEAVKQIREERKNAAKYLDDEWFGRLLESQYGSRPKFQEKK